MLFSDWNCNGLFARLFMVTFRFGAGNVRAARRGPVGLAAWALYGGANQLFGRILGPGGQLSPWATIGPRLRLPHGALGIVVHASVVVGEDCVLFHQTTLGISSHGREGAPIIGDRVVIYAGAKVVGPITIGDDAVIGANAVVTRDVPANAVVTGNPGRVTERDTPLPRVPGSDLFGTRTPV